jgi:hypothetical protein
VATFQHGATWKLGFIALMYLDVALTSTATHLGYVELNPVMAGMMASPWKLVMVKGLLPVAIAWIVPDKLLAPSIAFMLGAAGWNVTQLANGMQAS